MEIRSILFPTDFSEGSLYALPYAVDVAKACGARLYLFHVIYDIALTSALYVPYACVDPFYKGMEGAAAEHFKNSGQKVSSRGLTQARHLGEAP